MNNLYIVAPVSAISRRTRLFKLVKFLHSRKPPLKITHIGWERLRGEGEEHRLQGIPLSKEIIIKGGGYGGRKVRLLYLLWILRAFLRCLRLQPTDCVWALGFESAFPAVLASKIRGFKVYFDDADRFSMIFSLPRPLKKVIEKLEAYTSRNVVRHVVPGIERYDFDSPKFYILKNMPSERELSSAKQIYTTKSWPTASVVVNINGWLGAGRGMDAALALARAYPAPALVVLLLGKLDCAAATELAGLSNAHYFGQVSNAEALASYFASDLVLTYYDPASRINCLAESNKWGDAIKIGVGVIVNSEVETANYLRDAGATISVAYEDHQGLIKKVGELIQDGNQTSIIRENAAKLSEKFGYFEEQLNRLLEAELTSNE